jgi:hypothetical protein
MNSVLAMIVWLSGMLEPLSQVPDSTMTASTHLQAQAAIGRAIAAASPANTLPWAIEQCVRVLNRDLWAPHAVSKNLGEKGTRHSNLPLPGCATPATAPVRRQQAANTADSKQRTATGDLIEGRTVGVADVSRPRPRQRGKPGPKATLPTGGLEQRRSEWEGTAACMSVLVALLSEACSRLGKMMLRSSLFHPKHFGHCLQLQINAFSD